MKRIYILSILLYSFFTMTCKSETLIEFPLMKGPYMGQKPPGLVAEPFAPGIISKEGWELEGVFAPGMKEFYFTTRNGKDASIYVIGFRQKNSIWKQYTQFKRQGEVTFSPDGKRMHMADGYKDRVGDKWSERKSLGPMFDREDWGIMRLSASAKGTYVFDDYKSGDLIRISTLVNGKHQEPKQMSSIVNTGKWTAHPFIAPDESYLIWDSEREGGYGDSDLYISFKQEDGSWGSAINMGDKVNSDQWDAYASVTPDGKYILFNRRIDDGSNNENMNVDIYWVDAKIIETLRPKATIYEIAYSSKESGDAEIYLTDKNAQTKIKLTDHQGNDGYAAWSPDGEQIASYAYHDGRKTWSIHTMNADGTNRERLTHAKNKWDSAPAWSPDGRTIAFGRSYKDTEGVWQAEIWSMNSDGSEQRQIPFLSGGGPYFTPDGKIVFHAQFKDKNSEISIADVDGSNIIHLTNTEAEEWHPEVSPNGKEIAFMSDRDGNHEIYTMNMDGSDQTRLTFNEVRDSSPTWSPDGSQIMYSSEDMDGEYHIYVMNKDGSSSKKLIPNASGQAWLKIKKTGIRP